MNRWQKIAWFNLAVSTGTLILTGITIAILSAVAGMPKALLQVCQKHYADWVFLVFLDSWAFRRSYFEIKAAKSNLMSVTDCLI